MKGDFRDNKEFGALQVLAKSSNLLLKGSALTDIMIGDILSLLGEYLQLDRVSFYHNSIQNNKLAQFNLDFEWIADGFPSRLLNSVYQNVNWIFFDGLMDILESGLYFKSNDENFGKDLSAKVVQFQISNQVLFAPIFSGSIFYGFISFDDSNAAKTWDDEMLLTVSSVLSNLGIYIHQQKNRSIIDQQIISTNNLNQFYENILDNISANISVLDHQQKYLYFNRSSISDPDLRTRMIGKTDYDYCAFSNNSVSLAQHRESLFNKAILDKKAASIKEEFIENGKLKHELRLMTPVYDHSDQFLYLIAYGIDITDLIVKDKIITNQYLAIESLPIGIALLDYKGEYYYTNSFYENVFGYQNNELMGKSWRILYKEAEIQQVINDYFPILQKEGVWSGELVGLHKDGSFVLQDIVLATLDDGSWVCAARDITLVKEELDRVQRVHNQFELALNAANLGMWVLKIHEGIIEYHDAFLKLIGYDRAEIPMLSTEKWFSLMHPEDRDYVKKALQNHIENELVNPDDILRIECRILHKNGKYVWLLGVGKFFSNDAEGEFPKITGFNIDITPLKEAEIELAQSLVKEKELSDLKSRFVNMASHEFRTPLSTIRLGIEFSKELLSREFDYSTSKNLARIDNKLNDITIDVDRITDLMSDILTMGKLEASKIPFNPIEVSLDDFANNYFEKTFKRLSYQRRVTFNFNNLPFFVLIDPKLMIQVLENALSNAIKYSPENSPVEVTIVKEMDKVILEIKDYGLGISEEEMPFLFDSFFRSKNVENIPGTGLGMSIMKLFVELNHGELKVISKLNEGTSIRIYLPILNENL